MYYNQSKPEVRELVKKYGITFPSDNELVMLILGAGIKNMPVEKLAQKVLPVINESPVDKLVERLERIEGIGESKAICLAAAIELGRRRNSYLKAVINEPKDFVPFVKHFSMMNKEHFVCATLNGAHEIINIRVISVGTVNRTLIHPREIYADAIAERASGLICCHNHPYGSCTPSTADKESTVMLQKAAGILGITFLDHIILSRDSYFSFLEHGLLSSQ